MEIVTWVDSRTNATSRVPKKVFMRIMNMVKSEFLQEIRIEPDAFGNLEIYYKTSYSDGTITLYNQED